MNIEQGVNLALYLLVYIFVTNQYIDSEPL